MSIDDVAPVKLPTRRSAGCPFDPAPEYRDMQARGPIRRMEFPDGHIGWLVTSHALARTILADPRFSARPDKNHAPLRPNPVKDRTPPGMFFLMDPPDHTRYRRKLTGQFTVRRLRELEPRITQITNERLDAIAQAGPPVDLVPMLALPIPTRVVSELIGVPYADHQMFQKQTEELVWLDREPGRAREAIIHLSAWLRELVIRKRAAPTDDVLGGLVAAETDLTDEELANMGVLLVLAGFETTAQMIALGTFALLEHPDRLAALRADPGLIENTVEELLRYLTIAQHGTHRAALQDVELDGHLIRKDETVVLAYGAINRDPDEFTEPDALQLDRPNARHHMAFGFGIHQCLGQQLARIELRIVYRMLFERFPTLRLAVPRHEIPLREHALVYGVHSLPVTWDSP